MRGREQVYFEGTLADVMRAVPELEKLGYRVKQGGSRSTSFLYCDTQDGRFYDKGLRCRYDGNNGRWELLESGRVVSTGGDAERIRGGVNLIPLLSAGIRSESLVLERGSNTRVELEHQEWSFSKPPGPEAPGAHDTGGDAPAGRILGRAQVLSLASEDSPTELAYVKTMLANVSRIYEVFFDPLTRGLAVMKAPLPGAPAPEEFLLTREDTMAVLGHKVLGLQAYKMWANTEGTIRDLDAEFLHDLRVATRRARFALKILKSYLLPDYRTSLRGELKWIASLLGDVRDLDVYLDYLRDHFRRIEASGETESRVTAGLIEKRQPAFEKLRKALQSPRYGEILKSMRSLGEHLRGDTDLVSPALSVSPAYVKKAFRKVARHGGKPAREMTPKELHQLRIDFKGLRYTCEFFAGLYEGAMNPVIAGVKAFQDCLGAFQDAQVARETLSDLLDGFRSETDLPDRILLDLGALIQVEREISIERREEFISLWEKLDALRKSLEKTLASG